MKILLLLAAAAAALVAQDRPIVLKTSTLFDGKGKTLHNTIIVVEGSKITRVGGPAPAGAITYDLTALTVSPGWIDTHSHIAYHFDNNGSLGRPRRARLAGLLHIAENAVLTLNAGFTTIQSPGAMVDKDLREAIARGVFPGPRILTSLEALTETSGDAAKLREMVRERKQQGADFIKIFASKSIREGGAQTMTRRAASGGLRRSQGARVAHHRARALAPNRPRQPRWPAALRSSMAPTSPTKSSI